RAGQSRSAGAARRRRCARPLGRCHHGGSVGRPLHFQPRPRHSSRYADRACRTDAQARQRKVRPAMTLSIVNLDSALGAEVRGIDVSKALPQSDVDALEKAWRERLVLVFHGQKLSDPQLIEFSRRFGELDPPGPNPYGEPFLKQHPELNVISNVVVDGKPIGNLGDGEAVWHADMTYVDVPPKAAMLHSLEIPPTGGNTHFANMFAAYETLPAELKKAVQGKIAVHD